MKKLTRRAHHRVVAAGTGALVLAANLSDKLPLAQAQAGVPAPGTITTFAGRSPSTPGVPPAITAAARTATARGTFVPTTTPGPSPTAVPTVTDGSQATTGLIGSVDDVVVDAAGTVYFSGGYMVRKVEQNGVVRNVAGRGAGGMGGDGGPALQAVLGAPHEMALGPDGSVFVADGVNQRIRKVDRAGVITTVAGSGSGGPYTAGFAGDGGAATAARLSNPEAVVVGPDGSIYIGDSTNFRIRKVFPDGTIATIAGDGTRASTGDGGPAERARVGWVASLALGPDGSLYFVDDGTTRRITPDGLVGNLSRERAKRVALGVDAAVYISVGQRVRRIGPDGRQTTVAGSEQSGFAGDGGPAVEAQLSNPQGLAFGPDGSLYIADSGNSRVRRVWQVISPPALQTVQPDDRQTDVALDVRVRLTISNYIRFRAEDYGERGVFQLRDAAGELVPAQATYEVASRRVQIAPLVPLSAGTEYALTVAGGQGGVVDLDGRAMATAVKSTFRTVPAPEAPPVAELPVEEAPLPADPDAPSDPTSEARFDNLLITVH